MALQGMVVLEGASVTWTNRGQPTGKLFVTVSETAFEPVPLEESTDGTHREAGDDKAAFFSGVVEGEAFMKAVATALTWEGMMARSTKARNPGNNTGDSKMPSATKAGPGRFHPQGLKKAKNQKKETKL